MKTATAAAFSLLLIFNSPTLFADPTPIVQDSISVARLSSTSVGHPAAVRLDSMLLEIADVGFVREDAPVTVFIGARAAREAGLRIDELDLGEEGYVIDVTPGRLVLAGLNKRSTDYAVSTFLERYAGVRWYWAHPLGTVIPSKTTLAVPVGRTVDRPAFAIRWISNEKYWSIRNRLNVVEQADIGVRIKWRVHTWQKLVPPEAYADKHPEYYALIDGTREKPTWARQTQLCTSNPKVADVAAETILRIAVDEPEVKIISIDPMDCARMCECEPCRTLDEPGTEGGQRHSRRVALFYREIAERVGKKRPDLKLKGIVYWSYVKPPLDPQLQLPDNVVLQLCRFTCHNHGLDDPACYDNKTHTSSIAGWHKICSNLLFYEYYWKVSWLEMPWPILHTLEKDLPYLNRIGCIGVSSQFTRNYGSNGVVYWVATKLLWDPEVDVDALCEDYHHGLFGQVAGAELLAYWRKLEEAAQQGGFHIAVQRPYREIISLFTPELLASLESHITRAEQVAESDIIRERIELVRRSFDYCKLVTSYLREVDAAVRADNGPELTPDQLATLNGKAEEINEYVNKYSKTGAIGGLSVYTEALANPEQVARELRRRQEPHR